MEPNPSERSGCEICLSHLANFKYGFPRAIAVQQTFVLTRLAVALYSWSQTQNSVVWIERSMSVLTVFV
jgi:hypothetical protein